MSLEALKNIDPTAIYKAVKVTVKEDTKNRMVNKNFEINGQAKITPFQNIENTFHLVVGGWNGLITGPLVKATQDGDNFIIETLNSVYTLEKML